MASPSALEAALRAAVRGEVAADPLTLGVYATDASLYQITPRAVVCPLDEADLVAAVRTCGALGVPILPRAGGTSLGGSAVGAACVIDVSRHMHALIEVDEAGGWARVQPGLVRDNLNALLAPRRLMFAPDPATGNRAGVGGMIGNNSSGMRSLRYGLTLHHTRAVKIALADGRVTWLGTADRDDALAAELRARVMEVVDRVRPQIAARYPKILRRVQGYNLDALTGETPNLAHLIVGSEGSLATVLEAEVGVVPLPAATALAVAHFADLETALRTVQRVVPEGPSAVEIVDQTTLDLARANPATEDLCDWLVGSPAAVLGIEFCADTADEAAARAAEVGAALLASGAAYAVSQLPDAPGQQRFWAVRKAGLGVMTTMRGERKPMPGIEDCAVPLDVLPEFIEAVLAICARHDTRPTLYAHAGVGLIHVRPILSMKDPADIARLKAIADETFALVISLGGSISGEHGDGLARSAYLEQFFGPELMAAFTQIKAIFDPRGLMNPGKIVAGPPIDENLRLGPPYRAEVRDGWYRWPREEHLDRAIELCNGVGACRSTLAGAMCPTYRATRDESLSTRARANALRLANSGHFESIGDLALAPVLDTCLACKACRTECPSNVDLARLKAEALAARRAVEGASGRDHVVVAAPQIARWIAGPLAPLANAVVAARPFRWLNQALLGFDARRALPTYAREPFSRWFARRTPPPATGRRVVLFDDTWLRYHDTEVGISAVELLESCGYEVIVAGAGCCQRPAISRGDLDRARREGGRTLAALDVWLREGVPIVCCEPSCASALTDDLPDLIEDEALGARAREGIYMIDVWLAGEVRAGRLAPRFASPTRRVLVHGHCHQQALFGTTAMRELLALVPDMAVQTADCGCCGLAGSFGYDREHYDLAQAVAEDRLLPAVRAAGPETTVVACGFSCRHQIVHGTGVQARHWVEVIRGTGGTG